MESSNEEELIIKNRQKNVTLYNKYLIFINGLLISVLFSTGQIKGLLQNSYLFKSILALLILSLILTVLEVGLLIIRDDIELGNMKNKFLCCIIKCNNHNQWIEKIALKSFFCFLIALILFGIFIFTME
ncbi:MAG: hypothetical protein ACK4PR_11665 [Gammaproteobacteria bacterium]